MKIYPSDLGGRGRGAQFGGSVSLEGDYVLIGAKNDPHDQQWYGNHDYGAAYIYKRDQGAETWSRKAKLVSSDPAMQITLAKQLV